MNRSLLPLLFLSQFVEAQSFTVASIPPELLRNAKSVVRDDTGTFTVEDPGNATFETHWACTFLEKPKAEALTFGGPEGGFFHTKKMHARLFDRDGKLLWESERADIDQRGSWYFQEFSDTRTRMIQVDPPPVPFTVEFSQKIEYHNFLNISGWTLQHLGQAVEKTEYTLVCPADFQFKWRGENTDIQPTRRRDGSRETYVWSAKNLPALPVEANTPYRDGQFSKLEFAPANFQFGEQTGSMSSWASFGKFAHDLNAGRDEISPKLRNELLVLTASCRDNSEKIARIYRFLQENYRYVSVQIGIGGWQTFPATYVEEKKYGDCKALSNFMKAMLKAVGIPAYLALVRGDDDGCPVLSEDIVTAPFNHMILYVPAPETWLECTSTDYPPGYLSEFTGNRQALLLRPDGGKLVSTPATALTGNLRTTRTELTLTPEGRAQAEIQTTNTGELSDFTRHLALHEKGDEQRKRFAENRPFAIANLEKLEVSADAKRPVAQWSASLEIAQFANLGGRRMFVPLTKTNPVRRSLDKAEERHFELVLPFAETWVDTILLRLPEGFAVESRPEDVVLDSDFGKYSAQISEAGAGLWQLVRSVEWRAVRVAAARYGEARQFFLEVVKADGRQLVLKKI